MSKITSIIKETAANVNAYFLVHDGLGNLSLIYLKGVEIKLKNTRIIQIIFKINIIPPSFQG